MLELEKPYLAKYLPSGLEHCPKKEVIDLYFPEHVLHPVLRLRRNGDSYEITKKQKIDPNNPSAFHEETIHLSKEEFAALRQAGGKLLHKVRYFYPYEDPTGKTHTAQIGIFKEGLEGLVIIDFEFETVRDMQEFTMPDFCLVDINAHYAELLAGGMLCGKRYEDIAAELEKVGYKRIAVPTFL